VVEARDEVTRLLQAIGKGEEAADEKLLARIYAELRAIARAELAGKAHSSLGPTALVHEAFLRLLGRDHASFENRRRFFFAAARAMRDVLVERSRRQRALKRGGGWQRGELDDLSLVVDDPGVDVLALEEALAKLRAVDERKYELVQLRFYGGLTAEETAEVLGISLSSVERDWRFIRARLSLELFGEGDAPAGAEARA
jgi:RNA polymerase sigma factor (TIGR02999 family)